MAIPTIIPFAIAAFILYQIVSTIIALRRNIEKARASGIPYVVVPVYFMSTFWLAGHRLALPLLSRLPRSWTKWVVYCIPDFPWTSRYAIFQDVGHDTFLSVAPGGNMLFTCDPTVVSQITTRRNDFPKPTYIYRSVDIYGKNVVSSEGQIWRNHRKATSPPFTEANNHLVWQETIDQGLKMVQSWVKDEEQGKSIERVMDDTMRLSLHVISRAGFGRRLEWPNKDAKHKVDQEYDDPSKIRNEEEGTDEGHTMSYTYAIHCLLDNILFQFLLPRWMLQWLPSKRLRKADEAFREWGNYMKESVEKKRREVLDGKAEAGNMDLMGQLVKGQMEGAGAKNSYTLTDSEVLGNMFVIILAGHETAANSIHFSLLYLALDPKSQRALQKDLDQIFQGKPPSEWDYDRDLPQLFGGMVGAVMNEELRLVPPVIGIPKSTNGEGDHTLTIDGKTCRVPDSIQINLQTACAHRNPKYWPHSKPTLPGGKTAHPISNLDNDLEEFRPQRWLLSDETQSNSTSNANGHSKESMPNETIGAGDLGINEAADTSEKLYKPMRGAYFPFSEGYRSCLGRRFAQVEILAVIAIIFQNYSVELCTKEYATDAELAKMDVDELAEVWQKTAEDARELMLNGMGTVITLQMRDGHVKLRLIPRGKERFQDNMDEVWKKNHPERCSGKGIQNWRAWGTGAKVHGVS